MEMMQSPLFWYKIQFMVELLAAEALATYTMEKRKYFTIRVIGVAAGCFLVAFYFPLLQFNAIYTSIMFYLFFAVSILGLRICYDEEWRAIVFCATLAYTVQYIAYQSFQYLVSVLGIQTVNLYAKQGSNQHGFWEIFIYFFCYAVLYWAAWAFVEHPIRAAKKLYVNNEQIFVCMIVVVLTDNILNAVIVNTTEKIGMTVKTVMYFYNLISCGMAVGILLSLLRNTEIEAEKQTLKVLWEKDRKQYEISKETIDMINIKCHDLKHQLSILGKNGKFEQDIMQEIEKTVDIYDSRIETGNEILNVILTDKSLLCERENIKFYCMVDGKLLDNIETGDICSLFGNGITNAIEAVEQIKDKERRCIWLRVAGENGFISISIENYFDKSRLQHWNGEFPKTNKIDGNYHGFGMKSMKMIAKKYDGYIEAHIEDDLFCVNILLANGE